MGGDGSRYVYPVDQHFLPVAFRVAFQRPWRRVFVSPLSGIVPGPQCCQLLRVETDHEDVVYNQAKHQFCGGEPERRRLAEPAEGINEVIRR